MTDRMAWTWRTAAVGFGAAVVLGACGTGGGGGAAGVGDTVSDGGNVAGPDATDGASGATDAGSGATDASSAGDTTDVGSDSDAPNVGGDSDAAEVSGDSVATDVTSDGGMTDAGSDGGGTPAAWTSCKANADCVAVELACCDHCNGGKLGGFHKDHAAAAKAALGPSNCSGVACTEKACGPAIAWCEAGACKAGPDPAFGGGCKSLDAAACGKTPSCQGMFAVAQADACGKGGATAAVYQGCGDAGVTCGGALTCASHDADGKLWVFPSTCLPAGFSAKPYEACCKPSGGGTCEAGSAASLAKFCLQPTGGVGGLKEGEAFDVVVWPKGCLSSSCTKVHKAACSAAVDASGALVIDGAICLEDTGGGGPCTADCGGGGFAKCAAPKLAKGSYTAKLGGLTLTFSVPSMAGAALCSGSPW
ncbi:MAG: hypothetical protein FJ100_20400 [Deltaproteobacteria bacterium]|nr:hypothetical protein [Deltaproteobacteria bacterium]